MYIQEEEHLINLTISSLRFECDAQRIVPRCKHVQEGSIKRTKTVAETLVGEAGVAWLGHCPIGSTGVERRGF